MSRWLVIVLSAALFALLVLAVVVLGDRGVPTVQKVNVPIDDEMREVDPDRYQLLDHSAMAMSQRRDELRSQFQKLVKPSPGKGHWALIGPGELVFFTMPGEYVEAYRFTETGLELLKKLPPDYGVSGITRSGHLQVVHKSTTIEVKLDKPFAPNFEKDRIDLGSGIVAALPIGEKEVYWTGSMNHDERSMSKMGEMVLVARDLAIEAREAYSERSTLDKVRRNVGLRETSSRGIFVFLRNLRNQKFVELAKFHSEIHPPSVRRSSRGNAAYVKVGQNVYLITPGPNALSKVK